MARVQVDRIEGDFAVLIFEGTSFDLPIDLLPEGASEGTTLSLSLSVDESATQEALRRVKAVQERLAKRDDGGDFSL